MSSVREIARHAGVSPATVSRVLNNNPKVSTESRERVLAVVNERRYVSTVSRRSTSNLALLYLADSWLSSPFDSELMQGITSRLDDDSLDLLILDASRSRRDGETLTQMLHRKGARGAIVRATEETQELAREIACEGFPSVVSAFRTDDPKVSFVGSNSRPASRDAIEHLIDLGHRRIAIVLHIVDDIDHRDRFNGYTEALTAAGIPTDPRLVLRAPASLESGASIVQRLVGMPDDVTAVYITDPDTSLGAVLEAHRAGISVPNDLSIIGFDDAQIRMTAHPKLTAVCQDTAALGRLAVDAIKRRITHPLERPIQHTIATWLEVNGTTGPATR